MTQILIIEDEPGISSFIAKGLSAAGMQPTVAATARDGIAHALTGGYDLIVLDIGLPDLDGFEALNRMRGQGVSIPVIVLTARQSVTDRLSALEGGADDYMPKPFRFEELLARIRLRLRPAATPVEETMVLTHANLVLDIRSRTVQVEGREVDLSAREFALLETFMRHAGQVLSREQLLDRVWGYDFDPGSNVVDVYVRYLRRKIGADAITTVHKMGYRLA